MKEKDKIKIKVDSKNEDVQAQDNIHQQQIMMDNVEISVEQNSSDQTTHLQILGFNLKILITPNHFW